MAITERSKHIDVRYHFLREMVNNDVMTLKFTRTVDMLADILTKSSNFDAIGKFVSALMHAPTTTIQKKGE